MAQADADHLKLFTGRANPLLARKICEYLQIPLGRGDTELFPDGELIVKVDEDVRGRDCIIDKLRKSGTETKAAHIIGDVEGKNVMMVDDMITTAGTVTEACKALREHGAKEIYISATHAVFAPPAMERLKNCDFTKIAVT